MSWGERLRMRAYESRTNAVGLALVRDSYAIRTRFVCGKLCAHTNGVVHVKSSQRSTFERRVLSPCTTPFVLVCAFALRIAFPSARAADADRIHRMDFRIRIYARIRME